MPKIISTNPARNYEVIGEVEVSTSEEIQEKVKLANHAKKAWKELGIEKRIDFLRPIYEEFQNRTDEIAKLISLEMGKPITESLEEVTFALEDFEWYLQNATESIRDTITHEDDESLHKIIYEPFGTAAVITPWNFPFSISIWGIIPNLIVGNTVVFKISEECPLVGRFIEEVFSNHNLPKGVFSEVYGDGEVGKNLSESDLDLIWFTGSTQVGESLYKTAAYKFIKVVLEMGGSSPCIVFKDADIENTMESMYLGRFLNAGQVCDALKRFIVHESVFDRFVETFIEFVQGKIIGDSLSQETDIGSLASKRQLDLLEEQFTDAIQKGAKVITGGKRPKDLQGAFFEPTILTNITPDMKVWNEEVFGPILPIVSFSTEEEAISLANDTIYGLGARVISADIERAERVASKIEAGTVEINNGSRWITCNPFGGYKKSGMGRDHGEAGFRELCQVKVVSRSK